MPTISDYEFELPDSLIANEPLERRSASRLLLVDRGAGTIADDSFENLPELLRPDDILVLNNTKVFPARLLGESETGAKIEIFLINDRGAGLWEALARPARRLRPGKIIRFDPLIACEVVEKSDEGRIVVRFDAEGDLHSHLERIGRTPLPPYIKRDKDSIDSDRQRYQTVFAKSRGAIAAPTAGLHFTPEVLTAIRERGVTVTEITLHVGYGTFEPVREHDLSKHSVMPERSEIPEETAELINVSKSAGRRVIAVGTTSTRALEASADDAGRVQAGSRWADLTITPGYKFRVIDGLLTNFHLPKSSLLVLVSTFAGRELIMRAYRHAVEERYRFYSYGDCMLIV